MNAADALREGDPVERDPPSRPTAGATARSAVEVRDNGHGIPSGVIARIFDPFFTTKPIGKGTGLGLSVCHSIVTSFGGTIALRERGGQGHALHRRARGRSDEASTVSPVPLACASAGRTAGACSWSTTTRASRSAVALRPRGPRSPLASGGSEAVDALRRPRTTTASSATS